ncbi:MAG: S1 RNA-binding domain-containing protein, partial [Proteobacteria bacterium]|nr:S1 RNA-binding domain-containing protein [Pseudomonadota bacterium]
MRRPVKAMIGDSAFLKSLNPKQFADERFGTPTVIDILAELEKPGRDPRPEFKTAEFKEGVEKIADLRPGMMLEGVVTNVTAFGAFVDVGVHQDGLVHVSELADKFVKDPREIVKAGDVVKVRVKDVDADRKRIALTMKSGAIESHFPARERGADVRRSNVQAPSPKGHEGESALAAALRRAREAGKN